MTPRARPRTKKLVRWIVVWRGPDCETWGEPWDMATCLTLATALRTLRDLKQQGCQTIRPVRVELTVPR
jgi:hypothetical protein